MTVIDATVICPATAEALSLTSRRSMPLCGPSPANKNTVDHCMSTDAKFVPAEGGCACGQLRYRASGAPMAITLCHCADCRRACGAPALAWAVFRVDDLAWLQGEPTQFVSSPGVHRGFCSYCGTTLSYRRESRAQFIDVTAATFDHPERFAPLREIWTAQRLPWIVENPLLPQHFGSSRPAAAITSAP